MEINELEIEADRILRESLGKLFGEEKDPIKLIYKKPSKKLHINVKMIQT